MQRERPAKLTFAQRTKIRIAAGQVEYLSGARTRPEMLLAQKGHGLMCRLVIHDATSTDFGRMSFVAVST
jgi:hypothetical protein